MNQSLRFDKKDRDLLRKINEVIDSGNVSSAEQETFRTALHPHGIQNMVSTHEERMAMAEVNLLQRLNDGTGVEERLSALKTLHDEVLYSAQTPFRFNTSRVLIQLMKEIVRARGNEEEQLRLIHDFQKWRRVTLVSFEHSFLNSFCWRCRKSGIRKRWTTMCTTPIPWAEKIRPIW